MKFRGQYLNTTDRTSQDLSREYEQTYIELAPFARNEKGEFLNDSPFPKLVEGEKVNIQERINSFFEDVDLYSILKKVSLTGDLSYLDKKAGFYGDFSNLPNNYNDLNNYYKELAKDFNNLPDAVKEIIKSDKPIEEVFEEINKISQKDNKDIKENTEATSEAASDVKQEGEK